MKLKHGRLWAAAVLVAAAVMTIPTPCAFGEDAGGVAAKPQAEAAPAVVLPVNPLDGPRAFSYLEEICALGSRMSGSPGMKKQQEMLDTHFKKLAGKVSYQNFLAKNPLNPGGDKVPMANMLIQWHPERLERILLIAHYDTRPLPDRDVDPAKRRNGLFIGANDGGSGTALLMELAHLMPKFDGPLGVDFLLVDGEELVYVERRDPYCLGSRWFAEQYAAHPPKYKYRWGVVLDMVGDADLQVYQEQLSMTWRDSQPMVRSIWLTAANLGVKEFIPRVGYEVSDDHVPIRNVAKIPTCDIIDFNYMPWHQSSDTPQKCSGTSMAKVGWVVLEWMKGERAAKPEAAGN